MTRVESLEQRFFEFARTQPDAEVIDELPLTDDQERSEKADIFFRRRMVICEVKSLLTDTSTKIEPILEPLRERNEFPQFYGKWPIEDILARLPDGDNHLRQLYEKTSSAIPELVRKANSQIRNTKKSFNAPEAGGLLVVLNDAVEILNPAVIAQRIADTLKKKTRDGRLQFPEISGAWVISEKHLAEMQGKGVGKPAITIINSAASHAAVTEFLNEAQAEWASFNKVPMIEIPGDTYSAVKFSARPEQTSDKEVSLTEWAHRRYKSNSYLRSLTDDELLEYGGQLVDEMSLLSESTSTTSTARVRAAQRFGDLNDELNYRKVDLRDLRKRSRIPPSPYFDSREFWEITAAIADVWDSVVDAAPGDELA